MIARSTCIVSKAVGLSVLALHPSLMWLVLPRERPGASTTRLNHADSDYTSHKRPCITSSHVTTPVGIAIGYGFVFTSSQRPAFVRVEDQRCKKPDHFHEIIDWEICRARLSKLATNSDKR